MVRSQPLPTSNDPVLAGYDLVEYHNLSPGEKGVRGSAQFAYRYNPNDDSSTSDGYLYYFKNEENRLRFMKDPRRYLPKYGGFCAWGVAWEYEDKGWPWDADHMGPPCGPEDGWAILDDGKLYCSIFRWYQDDFNKNKEEGIRFADKMWIEWYGSLEAGPQNNGCYAWNWYVCVTFFCFLSYSVALFN